MMNTYMDTSVKAAIGYLKAFEQGIILASRRDDGQIDKQEAKALKRLHKATERYVLELENLLDD